MQLQIPTNLLVNYKSPSQRARVATEAWAAEELFCPSCSSNSLAVLPNNTRGRDFDCPRCTSSFQLKSQSKHFASRIVNSEYHTAIREIRDDRTPNLFALEYNRDSWKVENLFLIPHFAFSESMVIPRKPLGPGARRAGWTGCNYILGAIAPDARISYVSNGKPVAPKTVREKFAALRSLEKFSVKERGWALDVLTVVRSLRRPDFTSRRCLCLRISPRPSPSQQSPHPRQNPPTTPSPPRRRPPRFHLPRPLSPPQHAIA